MYPTMVREFDGSVRPSPISIVREQVVPSIYFLDMEIVQPIPGLYEYFQHAHFTPVVGVGKKGEY